MDAISQKDSGTIRSQFQYQIPLANKIVDALENQEKPVVLACTTSGGKSYLAIRVIDQYFKNKSGRTAVFLASNMNVLAQQFHSILDNNCPVPFSFSYSMIGDYQPTQLKIGLPQRLISNPQKISLLLLDEAQWLWKKNMMARVLEFCQPEAVLLLSGSPAFFTKRKDQYVIHYLSYEDIPNNPVRVFSKVDMDLVTVTDRNDIGKCIREFWRSAKHKRDDLSQLAVIARNVNEAEKVKQELEQRYHLQCVISTSQHDSDSGNLDKFKAGNHDCVITVNRIVAGWSYNNLTCVLDLTASKNINRSFQLFSRLLRVKNNSTIKSYHRICLRQHQQKEARFLHKMKSLLNRNVFANYTEALSRDDGLLEAV